MRERVMEGGRAVQGAAPHALVVEDHRVQQQLIRILLESIGWRVSLASDGLQALAAVKGAAFDLILMDRHMPRCGGDLAAFAIRATLGRSGRAIIICCSTDPPPASLAQLYDGVVLKPLTLTALMAILQRLRSERPLETEATSGRSAMHALR